VIESAGAPRSASLDSGDLPLALAIPVLVVFGYLVLSDLRLAAAAAGALVLAAWGAFAYSRPRLALAIALPMLMLAATKFRIRYADDTLSGLLDAQIVFELALYGFVGVAVLAAGLATHVGRRASAAEVLIAAYVAIAALSLLWSAAPTLTLVRTTQLTIVAGFAVLAVRLCSPSGALWITMRALAGYVLVCSIAATLLPWTTEPLIPDEGLFRFRWFATHPLDAATLAGAAAIFLIGVIASARTRGLPRTPHVWMRICAPVLVCLVVLTSSRGPMVALAAACGLLWLSRVRPAFRTAAVLTTCAAALAFLVFQPDVRSWAQQVADQDSAASRLFFRNQTADDVFELNGRIGLWEGLRPIIADHWALGTGYQASRAALLDVAEWAAYAHNALLQTLLDIGVIGLLSILGVILLGFSAGLRRGNPAWIRATVPALVLFLTLNSMSNESFSAAPDIELLILFICAMCGSACAVTHAPVRS
jgi:O-antigen ligase